MSSSARPATPHSSRFVILHLLVLVILGGTLWLATCGLWDLRGPDEARYVQVAKEILRGGHWLHLTVNGEPYDQKPPLHFWLIADLLRLADAGVSAMAARLPAVLMAIATLLLVYALGYRASGGNQMAGFASGLVLMTMPLYLENVPQAELNVPYAFWTTLALAVWYGERHSARMRWWRATLLWIALAGAFFTKGPLAILIVIMVIGAEAVAVRSWKPLRNTYPLLGITALALLISWWLFAEMNALGGKFVANQVTGETVNRLLQGSHGQPFWYYPPRIVVSLFPWSIVLLFALAGCLRTRNEQLSQALRPFVAWVVLPLIVLSIAHGKRQSYLIPVLPPIAVLVGVYLARMEFGLLAVRRRTWSNAVAAGFGLVALSLISLVVISRIAPLVFARYQFPVLPWAAPLWILAAVLAVACAFLFARVHTNSSVLRSPAAGAVALLFLLFFLRYTTVEPALDARESSRQFAGKIESMGVGRLAALRDAAIPMYHVYGNYTVEPVSGWKIKREPPALDALVTSENDAKRFAPLLTANNYELREKIPAAKDVLCLFTRNRNQPSRPVGTNAPPVFAVVGDTGEDSEHAHRISRRILEKDTSGCLEAVFLAGDNVYEGDLETSADERIRRPLAPLFDAQVPVFAALGNHDYKRERWIHELESPILGMGGFRYYSRSFDNGLITFFVIDSETLVGDHRDDPQIAWLRDELARCTSIWKVLVLHRPLLAGRDTHWRGTHIYDKLRPVLNSPDGDIDIVVSGHNHLYERRQVTDGVLHITAGSGGKLSDDFVLQPDKQRAAGYNTKGVALFLKPTAEKLTIEAVDEEGKMVDTADVFDHDRIGAPSSVEVVAAIGKSN